MATFPGNYNTNGTDTATLFMAWTGSLTEGLVYSLEKKHTEKNKEFVSIHKASCHSLPGDLY